MTDATITATPVNAPDVLLNMPLSRQVDVELETKILEPVSHQYDTSTGGRTTFLLPQSGVLDAPNCALVWELVSDEANNAITYPFWSGGLSMLSKMTVRVGGQILSEVNDVMRYATIRNNFKSQAEKEGVLDARHGSMNCVRNRPAPALLATGSANESFHQMYNPDADQTAEYGYHYNSGANAHLQQKNKSLGNIAGQSFQCVVRLSDVFKFFEANKLPLLAMAQTEIEIVWNQCGNPTIAAVDNTDSALIERPIPNTAANRVRRGTVTMTANPTLICDYIHYDDAEKQTIFNAINSGAGMRLNFTEVVVTSGVNPASTAATGGAKDYQVVESNHLIGMAMKEVKKIYVWKEYDLASPEGLVEIDGNFNGIYTHRSILDNRIKSQQIPGEKYNFIINNQRIYNKPVDNVALQHNYLSQCNDEHWNCLEPYYDTATYNPQKCKELLDTSWTSGVATTDIDQGRTKPYLSGSQHVIGLNLDKYNAAGNQVGNGQRISTAPIEFEYSRVGIGNNPAANSLLAPVLLTFFIEYRRSLIIRPLGVDVSDA